MSGAADTMISVADAQARFVAMCSARELPAESIPLACADGRVIASDVIAPISIPPFANSAMDGFALRGVDLPAEGERRFHLIATRMAGSMDEVSVGEGECVRITTGAAMPDGCDSVVIKERVDVDCDRIRVRAGEVAGAHVRSAGEDIGIGSVVMKAGRRITPAALGVLASLGFSKLDVIRKPRVVLLTTGDELMPVGRPLAAGQIYNSNGYSLAAQLLRLGAELVVPALVEADHATCHEAGGSMLRFMHVRDDRDSLAAVLRASAAVADLVISSGGVSAGEADFLPGLLAELGRVHFWKVRMRPGMPLLCGEIDGCLMVGLPGNPVSSLATLIAIIAPGLAALQGLAPHASSRSMRARISCDWDKKHDRTEFLRATLAQRDDGTWWATPVARQGSGMLGGMADSDVLLELDEAMRETPAGTSLNALRLD